VIERIVLVCEVSHKEVELSVVVIIGDCHAHASLLAAVLVDGSAGNKADFLKAAVALILVEEIRRRIVGNVKVNESVRVEVARNDAQPVIAFRV
jgi:hypothetical protein